MQMLVLQEYGQKPKHWSEGQFRFHEKSKDHTG